MTVKPTADNSPGEVIRLVETVVFECTANGAILAQGRRALRVRGSPDRLHSILQHLRAGASPAQLFAGPYGDSTRRLVAELRAQDWLTSEPQNQAGGTTLERQIGYLTLFGSDALRIQERISVARVAIIGIGGIGSIVAQQLVAAGVRQLWLVDYDEVAIHNLNRQFLFTMDDIGKPKVVVAARALCRVAPDLHVQTVKRLIVDRNDMSCLPSDLDILVVAADTPPNIVTIVWEWAVPIAVPIYLGAVGLEEGYWGPLLVPRIGHCWHCFERARQQLLKQDEVELEAHQTEPTPYSFGPSNSAIAAFLAHDALHYLGTGQCNTINRRCSLDFALGQLTFFEGAICSC